MHTHLTDEQLILYYYGEAAVDGRLDACPQCRAAYRQLQVTLNAMDAAPVPERGATYGGEVWDRIAGRLRVRAVSWWREWRHWAQIGAVAALVLCAFLVGRYGAPRVDAPVATQSGERILLVALGDHLERSQMVLVELANAPGADTSIEQRAAGDLVEANRIYRQAAERTGAGNLTAVLEDLERVLLEVAHSPEPPPVAEIQGVLFKVRVIGSEMRKRVERKDGNEESTL